MAHLLKYKSYSPSISQGVYLAPSADIIGRCFIQKDANIWFNTVVRGDVNEIHIGEGSNIQDLSMLHVVEELPLIIGKGVSVGHSVTLHACTVKDHCLIGMGSTILDGAVIGENSLVAAGSLVPPGKEFPAGSFIMGSPAKLIRQLSDEEKKLYGEHYLSYLTYKDEYLNQSEIIG